MTTRFCPICANEVEDTGGFCLLGHSLKVASAVPQSSELRAEVHRAFDEARIEVAAALADAERSEGAAPEEREDPISAEQPVRERRVSPFAALEEELPPSQTDPISVFSPPARMDWGPERLGFMKLRRFSPRRLRLEEAQGR
jgi:hypothetical protein